MENYSKGKLLGKGSFGSAWLCTSALDAKNYVIKEVDISRMPRAEREAAEQEAKVRNLLACQRQYNRRVLPPRCHANKHPLPGARGKHIIGQWLLSCTVLQLLLALKHPNIVRCKECFPSGSKLCIVMDWCSEGEQRCICSAAPWLQMHAPASSHT
eukprot:GHRQ01036057.1.p1 GENE.GHRQ01036057.1~~GHRQ01036057.1.p1  ORF type:complete len:156 (+),score=22.39 GHRQ01036057.1:430-897(+)